MAQLLRGILVCSLLFGLACRSQDRAQPPPDAFEPELGYPPMPWRLARPEINAVRLSVSHILVSHREAMACDMGPCVSQSSSRSPEEARGIVRALRRELVENPDAFERLAERRSDDRASAPFGGHLGVLEAPLLPDSVLDAVASIDPGVVSRIVESRYGFHLIRREPIPPVGAIAGRRMLIGYDAAAGGQRTRAEALALAEQLRQRLATDPDDFATLVRKYSSAPDAVRGGSFVLLSTHDGGELALLTHVLAQAPLDEVAPVVETREGFWLAIRTEFHAGETLSVDYVMIRERPDSAEPRPAGQAEAPRDESPIADVARVLAAAPERFDEVRSRYCSAPECDQRPHVWLAGTGNPAVEQALAGIAIGEVSGPIRLADQLAVFVRKAVPSWSPPSPVAAYTYTLPSPEPPPAEQVLDALPGDALADGSEVLKALCLEHLSVDEDEAEDLTRAFDEFASAVAGLDPAQAQAPRARLDGRLRDVLGPARMRRFVAMRDGLVRRFQYGI